MASVSILPQPPDDDDPPEATRRIIDCRERVFYCGYWVKTYPVPPDSLQAKRFLIEALARRLFNHTEHGLNMPGSRLAEARAAFEGETEPTLRRVKGGMLAGALFNRAVDIFRHLVDLQADGVAIESDYSLVRECGECLKEAMTLGRLVLHRSGEEGIDELWGEPFRVFSLSIEEYFESRYIKIGQSMRDIDRIAASMKECIGGQALFAELSSHIQAFALAARAKTETLRTDPDIFEVWPRVVIAGERLVRFVPTLGLAEAAPEREGIDPERRAQSITDAQRLIRAGRDLILYVVRARTPMPKSTREYIARCEYFRDFGHLPVPPWAAA